jgi:beta-glucosidase
MEEVSRFDGSWELDQGNTEIDEETLRKVHLPPYIAAIEAGARNIMVSHSSWNGVKMHANHYMLTEVLKGELGFKGFLVSDWMGIQEVDEDQYKRVVRTINAGLDMIMVPYDFKPFIANLTKAVQDGVVPIERIDDAVRRILQVKMDIGLFNPKTEGGIPEFGSASQRELAREAVRKSLVLLKNRHQTLPLPRDEIRIDVAGQGADDIGLQCGGWTIEWQGGIGDITPGTSIVEGIRSKFANPSHIRYDPEGIFSQNGNDADVGIVVISEPPYAEGAGDRADLTLPEKDVILLQSVRQRCNRLILILITGRPLILTDYLPLCDAIIVAWLPGTEGDGVADVLFGDHSFHGKLPCYWPSSMSELPLSDSCQLSDTDGLGLFSYGYGLET